MKKVLSIVLILLFVGGIGTAGLAEQKSVTVLTPYLQSVTTNEMIQAFRGYAEAEGWRVTVIDTRGDFNELANRWEDVLAQGTDAIVMGMGDPNQVRSQIEKAVSQGIPVFGGDAGLIDGMQVNVTSNNYVLAAQNVSYLLNRIGSGKVVKFYHSAHPGVYQREVIFDAIAASRPDIEVVAEHFVQVPGPIEDAMNAMQSILLANPDIVGVWAAWDEPAIGATLAIQQAGRADDIVVVGIDGNSQALEMLRDGSPIKATVRQDFEAMGRILVEHIRMVFAGEQIEDRIVFAPSILITETNVHDFLD